MRRSSLGRNSIHSRIHTDLAPLALEALKRICIGVLAHRVVHRPYTGLELFVRSDLVLPPGSARENQFTKIGTLQRYIYPELPRGFWIYELGKGQVRE